MDPGQLIGPRRTSWLAATKPRKGPEAGPVQRDCYAANGLAECSQASQAALQTRRTQRILPAAASGWSPNSCAIRAAQPPTPNCRTAQVIAFETVAADGASDGSSAEANSASHRASLRFSPVALGCVVVGISYHPVAICGPASYCKGGLSWCPGGTPRTSRS